MDLQKEREAFEKWAENNGYHIEKKDGNYVVTSTIHCWLAWQAKAQAVPEATSVGDELQSWVAVNSFAASDAVGDFPIIDANALAEVIEKLTGANQ
ncbi:hypothetical protein [Acinetobacter schindleri]|uniref:hypothetical protein n=1 Tax=Acinetobacter schindleri TaxID=108981 RepID=UPI00196B8880|nr:hypothetical protein [Acinetobacter schindleri]